MVFSSVVFLFYFLPIVLLGYYGLAFSRTAQNIWLLIASIIFYAWGEPVYVFLLLISIIANYFLSLIVSRYRDRNITKARGALIAACIINLGFLFFFKYLGFTCEIINGIAGGNLIRFKAMAMPIGISFYTFQALSYVIDVYRKDTEAQKNPLWVGLYITFFPQLVAGPIVRYKTIADQIINRKSTWNKFTSGLWRFAIGLSKKVLLANNLALVVDNIYKLTLTGAAKYSVPVSMAWLGSIAYTLQIYFDFSAYSDMAIGLGKMFGFEFDENFNYPYISKSIGEFWRRWHISLGTWFKEYVYFPLGGSRVKNKDKMVRNILIVWALTGIWHGAYWTFIFWGLFNFILLLTERIFNFEKIKGHDGLKHAYALIMLNFGWVIFRADNLIELRDYIGNMFGMNGNAFYSPTVGMFIREYGIVFLASIVLSLPVYPLLKKKMAEYSAGTSSAKRIWSAGQVIASFGLLVCVSVSILYIVRGGYNPFIYFNF